MVAHISDLSTWEGRQEAWEFEASLGFIVSCKPVWGLGIFVRLNHSSYLVIIFAQTLFPLPKCCIFGVLLFAKPCELVLLAHWSLRLSLGNILLHAG